MNFSNYVGGYGTRSGKRFEDLADKLALAVQSETPFQDMIGRGDSSMSSEFRWVEEALDVGRGGNAQHEGADLTDFGANFNGNPALSSQTGYTQILARGYIVSDSYRMEKKANVKSSDELTEQEYNKMIEIKTDLEVDLLSSQGGRAGMGSTVFNDPDGTNAQTRQLTGALAQIATSNENGQVAPVRYNTANNAAGGTGERIGTETRTQIDEIAGVLYDNGGLSYNQGNAHVKDASVIMMNSQNKIVWDRVLDGLDNNRRDLGAVGTRVGVRFTSYMSTFGDFEVYPNKYMPDTDILMFAPDNWALQVHTNWYVKEIAPTGLAEKRAVAGEFGLMHRNRFVSGRQAEIDADATNAHDLP